MIKKMKIILMLFSLVLLVNSQNTIYKNNNIGKWSVSEDINPFDDSKIVILRLKSDEPILGKYGSEMIYPTLLLRYKSGKTNAYISWGMFIGSEEEFIKSRFGNKDAKSEFWSVSTDYKATFAPKPQKFINELLEVNRAIFEVIPYGEGPRIVAFDVRGLKEAINPYADYLGWLEPQYVNIIIEEPQTIDESVLPEPPKNVLILEKIAKAPIIYYFIILVILTAISMSI